MAESTGPSAPPGIPGTAVTRSAKVRLRAGEPRTVTRPGARIRSAGEASSRRAATSRSFSFTVLAANNTAFTVTYSNYLARVGPGSGATDFVKNCQLNLRVHVPQGFTYAIAEADYRGYAHLEPGATGQEQANYYFQGMPQTATVKHPLQTPYDDDWQVTETTDVAALVYAPCGEERNFNVNTQLKVNAGTSDPQKTSFIAMYSTDGSLKTTYHFAWKQC